MDNETIIQEILFNHIKKNLVAEVPEINVRTQLFKEGICDSMAFLLLIEFIQEKFNIKPTDDELVEENFESVETIARFIQNKKEQSLA